MAFGVCKLETLLWVSWSKLGNYTTLFKCAELYLVSKVIIVMPAKDVVGVTIQILNSDLSQYHKSLLFHFFFRVFCFSLFRYFA